MKIKNAILSKYLFFCYKCYKCFNRLINNIIDVTRIVTNCYKLLQIKRKCNKNVTKCNKACYT